MNTERNGPRDDELLSEPVVERVLARASEIDATRASHVAVGELRAAAVEAGISTHAFEAALAELHAPASPFPPARVASRTSMLRTVLLGAGVLAVLAIGAVLGTPRGMSRASDLARFKAPLMAPGAPLVDRALLLRCLTAAQGAELVRPVLVLRANAVVVREDAPAVLRVRATEEQLQRVMKLLNAYERPDGAACSSSRPTPGP